ncbi:MAG: glycosyltransferase [Bacteroidales bacterium]
MKIYLFYHSIISDWNHGNAHFLRGIVRSLLKQNHEVIVYEPSNGWSLNQLMKERSFRVISDFGRDFPELTPRFYNIDYFTPEKQLSDADVVIVHEWNSPKLVKNIGDYRAVNDHFSLFFHDTHHRSVTNPQAMARYDLKNYDGVLAFGEVISNIYKSNQWSRRVFTWHEAADVSCFYPRKSTKPWQGDLVWIGNWGDNERTEELREFIIEPVKELNLKAVFYGVQYPENAVRMLEKNGIEYRGWLPNRKVPEVFSRFRLTVHVPRRPYVKNLPGIPTIRPFEALASGIPLACSWWEDSENLFTPGKDYLVARNGEEMKSNINRILNDKQFRKELIHNGQQAIRNRHSCDHRVTQLLDIINQVKKKKTAA